MKNEINLRRVYEIGEFLKDFEVDEDELVTLARELVDISGICPSCRGTGEDGEPPDPDGTGGGQWACKTCKGKGHLFDAPIREIDINIHSEDIP